VLIDGALVAQSLDGLEVAVDPGRHVVRFEGKGFHPAETSVLIRLGEKRRQIATTLIPSGPAPAATPHEASSEPRPIPASVFVAAGAGVAALGVAGILDWMATADALDLKHTCSPHCVDSETDPIRTKYTVAGIAAGAGGLALGAAVVLYLTRPTEPAARAGSVSHAPLPSPRWSSSSPLPLSPVVDLTPVERGAIAGLRACF
ncbi:MAG: uncharacterized protein K0S65_983, partial [Labilithrix sp.]|nr:uncharacterized protein [Labilithrix sp.]